MSLVEAQMLELKRELDDLHGLLKTFCSGGKFFRLTIRNREGALPEWISPRQKRGLLLLEKSGSISTAQYAEANGISRTAALTDISELIEKGLLEKSGQTKGSKYRLVKK